MNIRELKDAYKAAPFQPFDIVLTNGRAVHVAHPEFMAFSPRGRTVVVYDADGLERIDIPLIISLKIPERSGRRGKKR